MLCRAMLRGCCQPPTPARHGPPEGADELEVAFVEVRRQTTTGYRDDSTTETVTIHEEVVPPARRTWDCTSVKDNTSEISTTCSSLARDSAQDGELPAVSCSLVAEEPFGELRACSAKSHKCMGPDALAMNEGAVEIDLSAEFPPERREAQEDFAQINAASLGSWEHDLPPQAAMHELKNASRLLEVRVIRHGPLTDGALPWNSEQSEVLYEAMGMQDPEQLYTVVWLQFGSVSLLLVADAADRETLEAIFADDPISRLKFLIYPVRASVKFFPTKPPKDVPTIGSYFGQQNVSCAQAQTASGVNYTAIRIDLHAKFFMRVLLQKLAFRKGNVVDMLLVDWPTKAMVASCRLLVTEEVLQLLGPECSTKPDTGRS